MSDLPETLLHCASWLSTLLYLAAGVVALTRLKATPSGLLIGGGFVLWAMANVFVKLVRLIATDPESFDISVLMMINATSSCIAMFFSLIVAVGFAMLPRSLEKLEGTSVKLGPREG